MAEVAPRSGHPLRPFPRRAGRPRRSSSSSRQVRGIILEDPPTHDFLQQIPGTGYEATFNAMQSLAGSKKSVEEIALTFGDTLLPLKNGQTIRLKETRDAPSLRFSADCLRKVDPEVFTPILELQARRLPLPAVPHGRFMPHAGPYRQARKRGA
ncbi:MAG: hypothetical protein U0894_00650 [Pirellulales bacterium]